VQNRVDENIGREVTAANKLLVANKDHTASSAL